MLKVLKEDKEVDSDENSKGKKEDSAEEKEKGRFCVFILAFLNFDVIGARFMSKSCVFIFDTNQSFHQYY